LGPSDVVERRCAGRLHIQTLLEPWTTQKLISSGVVDGLNNNKAKVTMRKSYGIRTYRVLELALYHSLGKLPEPESTHDFFCRKYALASVSIVLLHQRSEVVRQAARCMENSGLKGCRLFLREREGQHCAARRHRDVLASVDRVRNG
jgi:hypothetical protein